MGIAVTDFGRTSKDESAHLYTLRNANGMEAVISDFGAVLVKLIVPDKLGDYRDVVLGYDTLEEYEKNGPNFGATVGRNANRIAGGRFTLNDKVYLLKTNEGKHNLHSGGESYHFRMWKAEACEENGVPSVTLRLESPDGDQGFPGNALITVTYTLGKDNTLIVEYEGTCDQDTIFNMTNHSYFNLNGHDGGSILGHRVWMDADAYTPVDRELIPTGEIVPVDGTPMDFRAWEELGQGINSGYEAIALAGGYDHNFVLNNDRQYEPVCKAYSEKSGIVMTVFTDLPGMQMYTGNFLDGTEKGKGEAVYGVRSGVCFETQMFPDAINHKNFPDPVVSAGERYYTVTAFQFE